jgi:hypothetical protein
MNNLQAAAESDAGKTQLLALSNLRNCVQSAASVVSSASTTLGLEHTDHFSVTYGSEFGDCFPSEPEETMLRWISSNTVYEFENNPTAVVSSRRRVSVLEDAQAVGDDTGLDISDSDSDLEVEMCQALMARGKKLFQADDLEVAERLFRNCLARLSKKPLRFSHRISKSIMEAMELLVHVCLKQERWDEAESLLLEKTTLKSRDESGDNDNVLSDMLTLIDIITR